MDQQMLINILLGALSTVISFLVGRMWGKLDELQKTDSAIMQKVSSIEILVAGQYVPRSEFSASNRDIFDILRRIEEKLDNKADKI